MLLHYIQIILMSVSLLVGVFPDWNYTNIGISQVLDEKFDGNIFDTVLVCWYTISKNSEFNVCLSACVLAHCLTKIRQRYIS